MTVGDEARTGFSLRRWSARKRAAVAESVAAAPGARPAAVEPGAGVAAGSAAAAPPAPAKADDDSVVTPLPPIDTLTPASDFTPFMRPDVDPALRRAALHKLFADPQFNVMDGLDVYIDDYSKPDPISPEMVRALHHMRYIFAPPATRVNEAGHVEDVSDDERSEGPAAATPGDLVPPEPQPEPLAQAELPLELPLDLPVGPPPSSVR